MPRGRHDLTDLFHGEAIMMDQSNVSHVEQHIVLQKWRPTDNKGDFQPLKKKRHFQTVNEERWPSSQQDMFLLVLLSK